MTIEEKTIIEALSYDDEEIGKYWKEIITLIDTNPFSERIKFLLEHQELATKPVKNLKNIISTPNCIGTAFYIAGVSQLDYPYQGYDFELDLHMEADGNCWEDIFRVHKERIIPGAFNFSYYCDDWHAGIYLGIVDEKQIFFAQHGHGGKFGPESLRKYANPKYYIPRTLKKTIDT